MSNDAEINLNDLSSDWQFLPAWAQEAPATEKYAGYRGDEGDRPQRRGDRGKHGDRRPPRRDAGPRRDGGSSPGGSRGDFRRPGRGERDRDTRGGGRFENRPMRPEPPPLVAVHVAFRPDDRGVESLARQLKISARAYPLFQIAQMILEKPERHTVTLSVVKGAGGAVAQPLFLCALDSTLWLSADEAAAHLLEKHFATFYQAERTPCDPPKGTYTFVAQCGISGVILGPPNHHDYQNNLRRLHTDRFDRMPFEAFKLGVKIVKDEVVVKKWLEEQSFKTEYNCLNVSEPLKLATRAEAEQHFRQSHLPSLVKSVESHTLTAGSPRALPCRPLATLLRVQLEEQRRFPLQMATLLSQLFASHGLQFFKREKTITHVCVARPHHLDMEATPVSDGVRRIMEFVHATPRCTRKMLIDALAPAPALPAAAAPAQGGADAAEKPQPTAEQSALLADLHWVLHQGHVIEFSSGLMETAKRPLPRPEKPAKPAKNTGDVPAAASGYLPVFNLVAGLVY
jgi:hypothetical protein